MAGQIAAIFQHGKLESRVAAEPGFDLVIVRLIGRKARDDSRGEPPMEANKRELESRVALASPFDSLDWRRADRCSPAVERNISEECDL
jgi:hypothetical protein